ncbi:MAG: glutamate-5-semialdehyde dehydrogenase [Marinifilaceae bacterium]
MTELFQAARVAARELNLFSPQLIDEVLRTVANRLRERVEYILCENAKDLEMLSIDNPMYDRLLLNRDRIELIALQMEHVASLPSPIGHELDKVMRPNGLLIRKVSVPFGVIGVIYESRPNVSCDVFALCLKSGNVSVLKGGKEARFSNEALVGVIREVLNELELPEELVTLLPSTREATAALLGAVGWVDLIIPRGSKGLIDYVRDNAKVPVIETGAGICHTYFDEYGRADIGALIINNAKTRRVSVCNALDTLIIHSARIAELPSLCCLLAKSNVIIEADAAAYASLKGHYPDGLLLMADEASFGTEFLAYRMSVKTVDSIEEALEHINRHTSHHSEAIISDNATHVAYFEQDVDAACIYVNASTAFTDGGEFGFGAEIGISTQKLHARGPMALRELTSYKYIIEGDGHIR